MGFGVLFEKLAPFCALSDLNFTAKAAEYTQSFAKKACCKKRISAQPTVDPVAMGTSYCVSSEYLLRRLLFNPLGYLHNSPFWRFRREKTGMLGRLDLAWKVAVIRSKHITQNLFSSLSPAATQPPQQPLYLLVNGRAR